MFSHLLSTVLTGIKVMCVMIFYAVVAMPTRETKNISISNPVLMVTSLFFFLTYFIFLAHWCPVSGQFHFASCHTIFIYNYATIQTVP
jgi:hypothetical protein